MSITLYKPTIRRKDMQTVLTAMVSDTLGPGVMVHDFALGTAKYLSLTYGLALRCYSSALEIVLEALGLEPGAGILMSALSPASYSLQVVKAGFTPIYADVEQDCPVLSLSSFEAALGKGPSAILLHYHLGFVQPIEEIRQLTQLPLVEDISQCPGGRAGEKMAGTYGNYAVLSCESDSLVTSGGGALLLCGGKKEQTQLKELIRRKPQDWIMGDINAALGKTQIESLETFIAQRAEIARVFHNAVLQSRHKNVVQKDESVNVHYGFPVMLSSGMKDVQQYAGKKKIETRPAFEDSVISIMESGPEILSEIRPDFRKEDFPKAAGFALRCLNFPLYPTLGKKNIEQIAKVLSTLP